MYTIKDYIIPEIVEKSSAMYGKRPALGMIGKEAVRYEELEQRTRRVAALLGLLGIAKRDRVGLVSESRPEWGISYFGASRSGATLVPLMNDFTPEQMGNILEHSGAKVLLASRKMYQKVAAFVGTLPVIAVDDLSILAGTPALGDLDAATAAWKKVEIAPDDLASIIYTSGTTGKSKGVMLTHRNLVWDAFQTRHVIVVKRTDVWLSILPLAHAYEFTIGFLIPIMQGSSIWYLDKPPVASALLPAIAAVRPTIMLTVPLIIEKVYRGNIKPTLDGMSLYKNPILKPVLERVAGIKLKKTFGGRLRFFGVGGAPLAEDVERFLRSAKFPYAIGYGLTETAPMLSGSPPWQQGFRATGPAMPGVDIRIVNPHPETGEGEIEARGPNVFQGYYKDEVKTREVFTEDGWFKTGDLGFLDGKKRVCIRGRSKTMILGASGENIYPEDIEAIINSSPHVAESLVYGDENGLTALINLKPEVLEDLEARFKDGVEEAGFAATNAATAAGQATAKLLELIRKEANLKLAAFSRIGKVERQPEPFEKTPKQSIKRFLYPQKKK
ncbi:MAG: AMP-binding protein [Rectinemataceae bacterium]